MSWLADVDAHPHAHKDACPHTRASHVQAQCVWEAVPTHHGPQTQRCHRNATILLPGPCIFARSRHWGVCRGSPLVKNSRARGLFERRCGEYHGEQERVRQGWGRTLSALWRPWATGTQPHWEPWPRMWNTSQDYST